MTASIDLDHVALAVPDVQPHLDAAVAELGGVVQGGGSAVGYRAMQVQLGDMRVELIQPHLADRNDFLARFLDRHGAGPHHLTFKVPDLAAEIDRLRGLGYEPVQIDLANVYWKECFLTPDVAHGTVVQIAQPAFEDFDPSQVGGEAPWGTRWWRDPPPRGPTQVRMTAVVLGSPAPDETRSFFAEGLGGAANGADLTWPGGGRIAVEHREGRPGIDRLLVDRPPERILAGTRFSPFPA